MKLRWEKSCGDSWMAYSGKMLIGMVVPRLDKTVGYTVTGVPMKWVGKGYGEVTSIRSGKRAVERAWRQWLTATGLVHPLRGSWHTFGQSTNPSRGSVTFTFETTKMLNQALGDLGVLAGWKDAD